MSREEVLKKYSALYTGVNPDNLRTLKQAREVARRLRMESFDVQGVFGQETKSGAHATHGVPEADLIEDGFPEDFPALFYIQGAANSHGIAQLESWLNSGLWNWGMKLMLRWWW